MAEQRVITPLYHDLTSEDGAILFKRMIQHVELETFSHCNRKCWFCANSFIPRTGNNRHMDPALFERILEELKSIDYEGAVNLSNYNEPTSDRIIIEQIRKTRQALPKSSISIYSNGDYIDEDYAKELQDAGINSMVLSIHTGNDEALNDEKVAIRLVKFVKIFGREPKVHRFFPGHAYNMEIDYDGMKVFINEFNMRTMGRDMGGLIDGIENLQPRTSPCLIPLKQVSINYNGKMMICCLTRSDAEAHRSAVVADLHEVGLFEAFVNERAVAWRRSLLRFGAKAPPCATCGKGVMEETPENRTHFAQIAALCDSLPGPKSSMVVETETQKP